VLLLVRTPALPRRDVNGAHREVRRQLGQARGLPAGQVSITYQVRDPSGRLEDVTEFLRIVHLPCRFGGARPYFICPGMPYRSPCGRRVVKLYCRSGDCGQGQ
jgi:hypothetical protein